MRVVTDVTESGPFLVFQMPSFIKGKRSNSIQFPDNAATGHQQNSTAQWPEEEEKIRRQESSPGPFTGGFLLANVCETFCKRIRFADNSVAINDSNVLTE